MPPLLLWRR
jgi:hypothetical protein